MTTLTLAKALNAGLRRALEADPKVVLAGEDIGKLGGVFRVTEGLQKDFGEHRVIDSPLAESGIIGTAVGMAIRGYRPVCEIQFDGFVYPAFDQIVSQVAKMYFRSSGHVKMPMVIRIPFGGGIGAVEHHSESPESYFVHTPGPQGGGLRQPGGRVLDDPAGDRLRRPGDLLRAQAALPREGRGGRDRDAAAAAQRPGGAAGSRRHPGHLRADGADLPGRGRGGRRGRPRPRGDRPALAVPAGPGPGRPVGARGPAGWWWCTRRRSPSGWARRWRRGSPSSASTPSRRRCCGSTGFDLPYPPSRVEDEYLPDLDRVLDAVDRSLAY